MTLLALLQVYWARVSANLEQYQRFQDFDAILRWTVACFTKELLRRDPLRD